MDAPTRHDGMERKPKQSNFEQIRKMLRITVGCISWGSTKPESEFIENGRMARSTGKRSPHSARPEQGREKQQAASRLLPRRRRIGMVIPLDRAGLTGRRRKAASGIRWRDMAVAGVRFCDRESHERADGAIWKEGSST